MNKLIAIALLFIASSALAQTEKVLDEVVAIVGEHVVLRSDLEVEYLQAKTQTDHFDGDLKCAVLNELIIQQLYLHKGELDSIVISPDRVSSEVDRRVQYYSSQIGGEAKLEKYLGKSIAEYKQVMSEKVRDQMLIQQVQQGLIANVKVSPTEVQLYYKEIPKDSLPTFDMEVELAQVKMSPKPNIYAKEYALEKITRIRSEIMQGLYSFEFGAKTQSDDKASAVNGGETGYFSRGQMVGPFERMAFKMKKDSISEIVETEFGYHILQLVDRKGEKVNVRHILVKPLIVKNDYLKLIDQMNTMIEGLEKDSVTLCHIASNYSTDPYTKDNCGYFTDPTTGSQQVSISSLDPEIVAKIESLKLGQYSKPEQVRNYDGSVAYRFFYYGKSIPAHKANLKQDYQKIQSAAKQKKEEQTIKDWIASYKDGVYVWIDPKLAGCDELSQWKTQNN